MQIWQKVLPPAMFVGVFGIFAGGLLLTARAQITAPTNYQAYRITDIKTIPPPPSLDPAHYIFRDPMFGSRILRLTDANTNKGESFNSTDSGFHHIWNARQIKNVFVIAMENHNWTQPNNQFTGRIQQIFMNPNAPFINSLVNGSAFATINGVNVHISDQVAYATAYHNALASPSGNNLNIHPSEPNYIWSEAGTNFGVFNDNDPYDPTGPTNQNTPQHLSTFLTRAGKTWRSYQEDIDLTPGNGGLTNVPLPKDQWTVPLTSFSGNFVSGVNQYNGSTQFNYAAKHNPMVFFTDTNGGNNPTPSNPLSTHYAPLQQLAVDLANDTVADYNWITPNQYNDMHTSLEGGYKDLTDDAANIKQGDDFLSQIVPMIMASNAYQSHGVIVIWWDESESDNVPGDNADDFNHTIGEIVISDRAHPNVNGLPYASPLNYSHSSDLRTWQEIFRVGPLLEDAANTTDLSDLFKPGVVPKKRLKIIDKTLLFPPRAAPFWPVVEKRDQQGSILNIERPGFARAY